DVVLLLVDARMPEITRNSEIVTKVESMKDKRLLIVFNKSDLISRKDISKLKKEYPHAFFVSALKKISIGKLKKTLENMALNWNRPSLRIGLVGYPNIGKSTLINLLAPGAKAKVSSKPGTTKKTQWVRTGQLRIMDSPGIIPFGDRKIQVGMAAAKDPHKINNPDKVALRIIEFLMEKDAKILKRQYGASGGNSYGLFLDIGRKKGFLIKGGEIDEHRVAIKVIDDWQKGKIKLK
ncbi:MAG: 50S ribosome-binding GTPase, partial [Candidatus Heimdallarchaeota archaeon]|nr:50S ribosome-binding GTPase [Candidatus Heimdallarchaeota archaeon]